MRFNVAPQLQLRGAHARLGWALWEFGPGPVAWRLGRLIPRALTLGLGLHAKDSVLHKMKVKNAAKLALAPQGPVKFDKDGSVLVAIHAKPGAKQNAVTDVSEEAVGVAIAAPPSDGEANAELVRYLAKVLELKRSEVVLDKGYRSREKVVKILAPLTPEEVQERLKTTAATN
ncbi:UPF0235 protein C15orf40 homolog isoform X2 [Carcharodon carcharias]|uniref:UPF0235 protein C15orf40 homolog isoform X2 n=1 Tax=Carcharodon carcharias TaxID=13397 RepID=UPI001B7DF7C2|nr:UPF0235 protein C15orf40 homolog isoform X2 [Carcharodon carcharias]